MIESNKPITKVMAHYNYQHGLFISDRRKTDIPLNFNLGSFKHMISLGDELNNEKLAGAFTGVSYNQLSEMENSIERALKIIDGKDVIKKATTWDLETVGSNRRDTFSGASALAGESAMFSVVEAASQEVTWENGQRVVKSGKNYVFGISEAQKTEMEDLISRYKKGKKLTGAEGATIGTLSKFADSIEFTKNPNKPFIYTPPASFDKTDVNAMYKGLENLRKIGALGYTYDQKGTAGYNNMLDYINSLNKSDAIMGQNTNQFDLPIVKEIYEGMTKKKYTQNVNQINLDTFEAMHRTGLDPSAFYEGTDVKEGFRKLEKFAKLFGGSVISHTAEEDIGVTVSLFDKPIDGEKSLMEIALDRIKTMKEKAVKIEAKSKDYKNPLFIAKDSVELMGFHGKSVTEQATEGVLDHVTNTFKHGGKEVEIINQNKQSAFKQGNIYEFLGFSETNLAKMFESIEDGENMEYIREVLKSYDGFNSLDTVYDTPIYAAVFENKTGYNKEKTYIFRDSKEKILETVDKNLRLTDITQKGVEAERRYINATNINKTINNYFEPYTTNGFVSFRKDMSAYNELKRAFEGSNVEWSKENLVSLTRDGFVTSRGNNKYGTESILSGTLFETKFSTNIFSTYSGADVPVNVGFDTGKMSKIINGFDFYEDIGEILSDVMWTSSMTGEDTVLDTYLLNFVRDEFKEFAEKKGGKIVPARKDMESLAKSNMIGLDLDGKVKHINISSEQSLSKSLRNLSYENINSTKNKRGKDSVKQARNLKEVAKELRKKRLITKDVYERVKGMRNSGDIIRSITSSMGDDISRHSLLSDLDKSNLLVSREKHKKNINGIIEKMRSTKDVNEKNILSVKLTKERDTLKAIGYAIRNTGVEEASDNPLNGNWFKVMDKNGIELSVKEFAEQNDYGTFNRVRNIDAKFNTYLNTKSEYTSSVGIGFSTDNSVKQTRQYKTWKGTKARDFFEGIGYDQNQTETAMNAIFGDRGFLGRQKNGEKIGVTLFTTTDNNLTTAKMILAPQNKQKAVLEAIKDKSYKLNPHMATIEIPTIDTINDFQVIGKGSSKTVIESYMDFNFRAATQADKKSQSRLGRLLTYSKKDSVDDIFSVFRYAYSGTGEDVYQLLKSGHGEMISAKINSPITKEISKLKPIQGGSWQKQTDGTYKYKTIMTLTDYATVNSTKFDGYIDLLPAIWQELDTSSDFKNNIYDLFSKNRDMSKSETDAFFGTWLDDITTPAQGKKYTKKYGKDGLKGKAGKMLGKDRIDASFLYEHLVINQNTGDEFLKQIRDSSLIASATNNTMEYVNKKTGLTEKLNTQDLYQEFTDLIKDASQIITESHVSDNRATTNPVYSNVFMGDMQDKTRPVASQSGNSKLMNLVDLDERYIDIAKDHGISFGEVVTQRKIDLENTYNSKKMVFEGPLPVEDIESKILDSMTIKTKLISDSDVTQKAKLLKDKIMTYKNSSVDVPNDVAHIEETLWNILNTGKERVRGSEADEKFYGLIDSVLTDFSHKVTNEQKTVASPLLSKFIDQPHFGQLDVSTLDSVIVGEGDIIKSGDIIGFDSNGKEAKYLDKRESKIIGMQDGKFGLLRLDTPATEQKYMSLSEKTVMGVLRYDDYETTMFAQELFESAYGKNVSALSNHEIKKHTSSNFALQEFVDIAAYAQNDGSDAADEYVRKKFMNLFIQGDVKSQGIDRAEKITTYKGTNLEHSTYIIPSNSMVNPKDYLSNLVDDNYEKIYSQEYIDQSENVVGAYKKVHKEILDDASLSYSKMINGEELDDTEKFLSSWYKDSIVNKDENTFTHTFNLTKVEKEYSVGADGFTFDDAKVASKTGKVGLRDFYWLGRGAGQNADSLSFYYDIDKQGRVTGSAADGIREHFMSKMKDSEEFIQTTKDLQSMVQSTVLMSQDTIDYSRATKEDMLKFEKDMKLDNKIHRMSADDLILSTSSTNPSELQETIFGIAGDKPIIRIDLDDINMEVQNPMSKNRVKIGDRYSGEGISGKTKYVYIANTKNSFVTNSIGEEMFIPSEYQKNVSNFINNLQIASTTEENAYHSVGFANNALKEIYTGSMKNISETDGLMVGKILNHRMDFSGMSLYGGIIAEEFDENMNHGKELWAKNLTIDLGKYKKGAGTSVIDVKYVSEKMFNELSGGNGVEDIGYQLVHNDFNKNKRFKKLLKESGQYDRYTKDVLSLTDDDFKSIGKLFLQTEGIEGLDVRYPSFNANTQVATLVRLKDDALTLSEDSDSSIIHEHTALKLNADTDGDTGMTLLFGRRGDNGRFEMFDPDSKLIVSHRRMMIGQAFDNLTYWLPEARARRLKFEKLDHLLSSEKFFETMDELSDGTGFMAGGKAAFKAYKAKFDKKSIGPVSNPNLYANQLAYYGFVDSAASADFTKLKDVYDFTSFTEQKIISAKLSSSSSLSQIDKANRYAKAMKEFGKSGRDEGATAVINVLQDMEFIDFESFDDYYNGKGIDFITNKSRDKRSKYIEQYLSDSASSIDDVGQTRKILHGVGSMSEMYSMDHVVELEKDTFFKHNAIKTTDHAKDAARAYSEKAPTYNLDAFVTKLKHKILNFDIEALENARALDSKSQSLRRLSDSVFVGVDGSRNEVVGNAFFIDRNMDDGSKTFGFITRNETGDSVARSISTKKSSLTSAESDIVNLLNEQGYLKVSSDIANTLTTDELKGASLANNYLEVLKNDNIISKETYLETSHKMHRQIIDRAGQIKNGETGDLYANLNSTINNVISSARENGIDVPIEGDFDLSSYTPRVKEANYVKSVERPSVSAIESLNYNPVGLEDTSKTAREAVEAKFKYIESKTSKTFEEYRKVVGFDNIDEMNDALRVSSTKEVAKMYESVLKNANKQFTSNVLSEFEKNKEAVIKSMNWNNVTPEFMNSATDAASIIDGIDSMGSARVYTGKFAGANIGSMSMSQIDSVLENLKQTVSNSSSSLEREVATLNFDAITRYKDSLNYGSVANNELKSKSILSKIDSAINDSNVNYTSASNVINNAGFDIGEVLDAEHKRLINTARMNQKAFDSTIDGAMSSKGAGKKAIVMAAGALVAGSFIAGTMGVAGKLDPGSKSLVMPEEEGVVIRRNKPERRGAFGRGNVPMEKRTQNIRGVTMNGENSNDIINALKVNYGEGSMVKINVNNESFDDNNNKWLEREFSGLML